MAARPKKPEPTRAGRLPGRFRTLRMGKPYRDGGRPSLAKPAERPGPRTGAEVQPFAIVRRGKKLPPLGRTGVREAAAKDVVYYSWPTPRGRRWARVS